MSTSGTALYHLVRPPLAKGPARPPLLVLLHGVGSNEADLFALAPVLDSRPVILSLRAPFTMAPGSYAWFEVQLDPIAPMINPEQAEQSLRRLVEFLPLAVEQYHADPDRIFVVGFSQGAIMSLALTLTRPELLAGVGVLSGRSLPELFTEEGPLGGMLAPAEALRELPILLVHGTEDAVLPIHFGRETRQRLASFPVELAYHELPMGHTISPEALDIVQAWLASQLDRTEKGQARTNRIFD